MSRGRRRPALARYHWSAHAAKREQRHKLPQRSLAGQIENATAGKPGNLAADLPIARTPKCQPGAIAGPPGHLARDGGEFSAGHRLAGPYSAPGLRPAGQARSLARGQGGGTPALLPEASATTLRRLPYFRGGDFQPRRQGRGIRPQRGGQVEVIVDLMDSAVLRASGGGEGTAAQRAGGPGASLRSPSAGASAPCRGAGERLRQQPTAPWPGIADTLGYPRQPDFQRRAG